MEHTSKYVAQVARITAMSAALAAIGAIVAADVVAADTEQIVRANLASLDDDDPFELADPIRIANGVAVPAQEPPPPPPEWALEELRRKVKFGRMDAY